jgi:acetyltransferase-like isoleucine patch superfamily enzyme
MIGTNSIFKYITKELTKNISGNVIIGKNFTYDAFCHITANGDNSVIRIGDNSGVSTNVIINADMGGTIKIGNNVLIAPNVVIRAANHNYKKRRLLIKNQGHTPGIIIIGNDVWIGVNSVILPDVYIGDGVVIGAGSVITKDIQPYLVVAGVPARKIGERTE